jgi:TRAP-type C4-dicarboxylate transport system permease small subunit
VRHFPKSLQLWLRVFSDCIVSAFAGYMVVNGIQLVQMLMNGVMASVPIEIGYTYLVVPISGGLMIVIGLTKAADRIFKFYVLKEFTISEGVGMHG